MVVETPRLEGKSGIMPNTVRGDRSVLQQLGCVATGALFDSKRWPNTSTQEHSSVLKAASFCVNYLAFLHGQVWL